LCAVYPSGHGVERGKAAARAAAGDREVAAGDHFPVDDRECMDGPVGGGVPVQQAPSARVEGRGVAARVRAGGRELAAHEHVVPARADREHVDLPWEVWMPRRRFSRARIEGREPFTRAAADR
jgi:hypothetical protein